MKSKTIILASLLLILNAETLTAFALFGRWKDQMEFNGSIILGRPTDTSITLNILSEKQLEVYFEYNIQGELSVIRTDKLVINNNIPCELVLENLKPDTQYTYYMHYRPSVSDTFIKSDEYSFHTQRAKWRTFSFAIQADSHIRWARLGGPERFNDTLVEKSLRNILKDDLDFLIDLGDTFFGDMARTYEMSKKNHLELRPFFGIACHSLPLFVAIGNHEGENGWVIDGTPDNNAVWAANARKLYYPNPVPNGFYTGCTRKEKFIGLRESYYAFEWGDALIVVLDPYWNTAVKPEKSDNMWDWTLGDEQYFWLKKTLESSNVKFKFIFSHQMTAGITPKGRGGIEAAQFGEWGGKNVNGIWGFTRNRPDWELTIHELMLQNNVNIFFHGHDHVFVKQELDGIIYQEVPVPGDISYGKGHARDGGYIHGDVISNSGYLRVTVSGSETTVDYVRAYLEGDGPNREIAYSYTIKSGIQ